jgi:uncharacterized membrane protein YdfJ with MMPL/SSD domain
MILDALARFAYRRVRLLIVFAVVFFVAGGAYGGGVFGVLKPFGFDDPASESVITNDRLAEAAGYEPSPDLTALVRPGGPVNTPGGRRLVARVARILTKDEDVKRATTPFRGGSPKMISKDGRSAYVLGFFRAGISDTQAQDAAVQLGDQLDPIHGVILGGQAASYQEVGDTTEKDLRRAEMFAFPILLLLSFWVFRSLVAALLPLVIGALSIVGALAGLRVAAELTGLSIFAVNLITALGLGLAIDYSLFVVSRYREELTRRGVVTGPSGRTERWEALRVTMQTAGRTVIFSALTVAAAMASLLVFPQRFLYSMGVGGVLTALFSALVAVTVLPGLLAMLGTRVNALAPKRLQRRAGADARPDGEGFWYRLSRFVMRRPVPVAMFATAVMIVAGLPFLGIKFTGADASILPKDQPARIVDDALKSDFPPGGSDPTIVEARTRDPAAAERLSRRIADLPDVSDVGRPQRISADTMRIDAYSRSPAYHSERSQDLVSDIRALDTSYPVRVTGNAAYFVDRKTSLADHLPTMLAIVIGTTFVILFLMTGSVILPIKTLIMNFLTVSAAFGFLVFIYQDGRLEGLLGYTSQGGIDTSMPLLLFALAFGLSTDYGVFLLTRIKEARDGGASDSDAVAMGLERTGRIVTAAALLLTIALGSLVTSQIIFIKENGTGAAFAVLIDASIVRALLVPSLMKLLGKWNWWAPGPLRRLHDRIGLAEGPSPPSPEPGTT